MKNTFIFISLVWFIQSNVFCQTSITASQAYNGVKATGEYEVYSYNGDNSLSNVHKPIIVVEGFDPNNTYSINDIYYAFSYPHDLAGDLQNAGYDIIILKFDNAGDYIQRNAFLLMELINQVNAQKPNSNDKLVVVGYSMGGLVARYALTYMESNNMDHQTRLYVSFDAPHKGAHVPASVQAFALTFNHSAYFTMFPGLQAAINEFTCPAAQQMLKYRISNPSQTNGAIPISSTYTSFMNEINSLNNCNGFPTTCRNIALSLGSWNQHAQRSNMDYNQSGGFDYQQSGVNSAFININKGYGSSNSEWILSLNTCQLEAFATFQVQLATAYSNNYPYYNTRANYTGTNAYYDPVNKCDVADATYLYLDGPGDVMGVFPQGAWSTLWWYGSDEEPRDFAPGSNIDIYNQVVSALNSQIQCSYAFSNNSTFIPTVSALAFDSDDLFYDIYDDPNNLEKTPFDAIYGITGDNLSHQSDQTTDLGLVTWLVDQITGNYSLITCLTETETLNGTVTNGQNISVSNVSDIEATNYTINSGATVTLQAGNSIDLKPGFHAASGSHFTAKITPCAPKSCAWVPNNPMLAPNPSGNNNGLSNMIIMKNVPKLNPINQTTNQQNSNNIYPNNGNINQTINQQISKINIYPNPNNGNMQVLYSIPANESGVFGLYDVLGNLLLSYPISGGTKTFTIDGSNLAKGVYFYQVYSNNKLVAKNKIVIIK